jgi:nitronate monooxygenase
VCLCRASGYQTSFCITDALLAAAIRGDMENGLFYTGQSVTRIPDRSARALPSVREIFDMFQVTLVGSTAHGAAAGARAPCTTERPPASTTTLDVATTSREPEAGR